MTHLPRLLLLLLLAGPALAAPASPAPATSASAVAPPPACPPAAQLPTGAEVQAGWQQARDRGFLWRIRKDGRESYLYGTLHIAKVGWMFPGPQVNRALQASDVLALEVDPTDPEMAARLQRGMAPKAEPRLSPPLVLRLQAQLQAACLPAELMQAMSPEMLGAALTVLSLRHEGLDPAYGIDLALARLARALGKPITSLETPELQLKLLMSESSSELHEGMDKVLTMLERGTAQPLQLRAVTVWEQGRDDELAHYAQWCECATTERERVALKALLDDRHPGMAERIDALHRGGKRVFAAVGSLHLVGPQGLPALLAARGYEVERVVFTR
jgi:uncharacterized protein